FTKKPMRSAPLWMSQDTAASNKYFVEQINALRDAQHADSTNQMVARALETFIKQQGTLTTGVCAMGWVWRERPAWNDAASCRRLVQAGSAGGPLDYLAPGSVANDDAANTLHWPATVTSLWSSWSGPVYVLADNRTHSAAEMFVAALQNNGAAKVVGTPTGGDGCGFMNSAEPIVLPHSRLRFRIPNCVRLRADGTDEVAGVRPDIPVLPTDGESNRARAMRVVDEVRKDVGRGAVSPPPRP